MYRLLLIAVLLWLQPLVTQAAGGWPAVSVRSSAVGLSVVGSSVVGSSVVGSSVVGSSAVISSTAMWSAITPLAAGWLMPRAGTGYTGGSILLKAGLARWFPASSPAAPTNAPARQRAELADTAAATDTAGGEKLPLISLLAAVVLLPLIILIAVVRTILVRRL